MSEFERISCEGQAYHWGGREVSDSVNELVLLFDFQEVWWWKMLEIGQDGRGWSAEAQGKESAGAT